MTYDDFRSPCWLHFTDELTARLHTLRAMNDQLANDTNQTAVIRGRIAEVKRILALGKPSTSEAEDPGE